MTDTTRAGEVACILEECAEMEPRDAPEPWSVLREAARLLREMADPDVARAKEDCVFERGMAYGRKLAFREAVEYAYLGDKYRLYSDVIDWLKEQAGEGKDGGE